MLGYQLAEVGLVVEGGGGVVVDGIAPLSCSSFGGEDSPVLVVENDHPKDAALLVCRSLVGVAVGSSKALGVGARCHLEHLLGPRRGFFLQAELINWSVEKKRKPGFNLFVTDNQKAFFNVRVNICHILRPFSSWDEDIDWREFYCLGSLEGKSG